jgi:hypothetical protein
MVQFKFNSHVNAQYWFSVREIGAEYVVIREMSEMRAKKRRVNPPEDRQ